MENTLDLLQDQMFEIKKHTTLRNLNDFFFKRLGRETYRANILYETNFFVIYSRNLMFTKYTGPES